MAEPLVAFEDTLFSEVAVYLPGATANAIKSIAGTVMREFYLHSGAWVVTLPAIASVDGQATYALTPLSETEILYVRGVDFKSDNTYHPLTGILGDRALRLDATAEGAPRFFYGHADAPSTITLWPAPDASLANAIKVTVSLCYESPWAGNIPQSLVTAFGDVIVDGVVARGLAIPDKPWTNILLSQYYQRRFRNGLSRARDVVRKQYTVAETPVTFPGWA